MSGQGPPRAKTSPKQRPLRATMPLSAATKGGSALRAAAPRARRAASLDAAGRRGGRAPERAGSLDSLPRAEARPARAAARRRSCGSPKPGNSSPSSLKSPSVPIKSSRSSEEGLNQEIESYILRSEQDFQLLKLESDKRLKESTPEGRKAPVADLLREPAHLRSFAHHSHPSHSSEGSQSSSPEQERAMSGSSPQINRFSSRAPPDGCERILSKSVPILRPIPIEVKSQPHVVFTLKPSSHSAFETLNRSDDDLAGQPNVPEKQN